MGGVTIRVPGFTAVPVHAADGSVWDVGVQWRPRTPRLAAWYRRRLKNGSGGADVLGPLGDSGSGSRGGGGWHLGFDLQDLALLLLVLVAAVAAVLLLAFVVVPLLLLLVDAVVLVVAALLAVLGRVLLGRPWRVVARCTAGPSAGEEQVREVHGVRAARRARDELRRTLTGGGPGVTVVPL